MLFPDRLSVVIMIDRRVYLVLADASLETIPPSLWPDPIIRKHSKKKKKHPKYIILDSLYHGSAIVNSKLEDKEKRGRPDIVHQALLLAQDSELNNAGFLKVYIHTIRGNVIIVKQNVRPPRNYLRFIGLMEQLFELGRVPPRGDPLISISDKSIGDIINSLENRFVVGFSRRGRRISSLKDFLSRIINGYKNLVIVIGAFPHGFFSEEILAIINDLIALSDRPLTTNYVLCRVISALEEILISP